MLQPPNDQVRRSSNQGVKPQANTEQQRAKFQRGFYFDVIEATALASPFTSAGNFSSYCAAKNRSPSSYFRTTGYDLVSLEMMLEGCSELPSDRPAHLDPVPSPSNIVNHEMSS